MLSAKRKRSDTGRRKPENYELVKEALVCGIETGENHNLPKFEGAKGPVDLYSARTEVETKTARQPQVTPEKEEAIMKAFKHFGVI